MSDLTIKTWIPKQSSVFDIWNIRAASLLLKCDHSIHKSLYRSPSYMYYIKSSSVEDKLDIKTWYFCFITDNTMHEGQRKKIDT